MDDPYDLDRFVRAQRETYHRALGELRSGMKRTHWIWYIFPQIAGLGHSHMSRRFAISGLEEAKAYLAHPILGTRLLEVTAVLADIAEPNAKRVFGAIDARKVQSSFTLFALAAGENGARPFRTVLDRWYDGHDDAATSELAFR